MNDSRSPFATDDQFIEAAVRYLDGTLAEADVALLSRELESDADRQALFADIALQAQMLKDYGSPTTGESVDRLTIEAPQVRQPRRQYLAAVLTAAALGFALAVVWRPLTRMPPPTPVAAMARVDGRATIVRASGRTESAVAGAALYIGDRLLLDDPDAAADLLAGELLRMAASEQAQLRCDEKGHFRLDRGELTIELAGDRPFRVVTPHAEFSAAAGEFKLLVTEPWTDLTVEAGRAELTSTSTSERTVVAERGRALVIPGRAVAVMTPPPLPTEWGEDFEHGLPFGWRGRLVTEGLPAGSRGAITVEIESHDDGLHYSIVAPDAWDTGLVRLTPTSHLNFTYRLGRRPNWCNLLLTTRPPAPAQPDFLLNRFRNDELWSVAGQWRTVRIPLAAFEKKRNDQFTTESPAAGEMVAGFSFSSIDTELDLTIDRIWLSADGPGRVTYEAVDRPGRELAP